LEIDEVLDEINNYMTTVRALQAFGDFIAQQDGQGLEDIPHSLARKMRTSPSNSISPDRNVSPDAVIQRSEQFGYVVEAKAGLSEDQRHWRKEIKQVQKYDDDLTGWWTEDEQIDESDVVTLITAPYGTPLAQYAESLAMQEPGLFRGRVSFVEYAHVVRRLECIYLKRVGGRIEDHTVSDRLSVGEMVPLERLFAYPSLKKFYSAMPPLEYLMVELWNGIFTDRARDAEFDEGRRRWIIPVTVSQLTREMQELFGSTGREHREGQFPKPKWIRATLEAFVRCDLAERLQRDKYQVLFYRIPTDLVQRFSKQRTTKPKAKPSTREQLPLFEEATNE